MPAAPPAATDRKAAEQRRAETIAAAKDDLDQVQFDILAKNRELAKAPESEWPRIARELQQLRVIQITLNELVTGLTDPTAKQEIALLSKLMGDDPEMPAAAAAETEEDAALARLNEVGISQESAENMVRGLRALQAVMQRPAAPPPTNGTGSPSVQ